MSVYNQAEYLEKAIKSILDQTLTNFEFLILDDGSTDNSREIINDFKDKRIKFFKNKQRQGLAKGLNRLIKESQGDYIARMDGDDISLPTRLAEEVDFLEKNREVVLVGSWVEIIDKKDRAVGYFKHPSDYQEIRKKILSRNLFIHPSVIFRKEAFNEVGGYDEDLAYSQDYDLFLRMAAKFPCRNISKILLQFRWLGDFTKQKEQHRLALKIILKALREYNYHWWEVFKLIKPAFFYLIPIRIKRFYWRRKLNS